MNKKMSKSTIISKKELMLSYLVTGRKSLDKIFAKNYSEIPDIQFIRVMRSLHAWERKFKKNIIKLKGE